MEWFLGRDEHERFGVEARPGGAIMLSSVYTQYQISVELSESEAKKLVVVLEAIIKANFQAKTIPHAVDECDSRYHVDKILIDGEPWFVSKD